MFSAAGVNHINDYIKLFKAGKVTKPMPHLIMIVDEFAGIKSGVSGFYEGTDLGGTYWTNPGRSSDSGTQKPAGVVDAQIWIKTQKFKLRL